MFVAWTGLVILSLFDDERYLFRHFFGIALMVAGIGIKVYLERGQWLLLLFALTLYVLRVIFKMIAIVWYEMDALPTGDLLVHQLFEKHMNIMYYGGAACKHPDVVLPIFMTSGLLQWVVFYLLLFLI